MIAHQRSPLCLPFQIATDNPSARRCTWDFKVDSGIGCKQTQETNCCTFRTQNKTALNIAQVQCAWKSGPNGSMTISAQKQSSVPAPPTNILVDPRGPKLDLSTSARPWPAATLMDRLCCGPVRSAPSFKLWSDDMIALNREMKVVQLQEQLAHEYNVLFEPTRCVTTISCGSAVPLSLARGPSQPVGLMRRPPCEHRLSSHLGLGPLTAISHKKKNIHFSHSSSSCNISRRNLSTQDTLHLPGISTQPRKLKE